MEVQLLGQTNAKPWYTRLLPLLVLIAIMMSGLLIPSTTLASEKQNKTIDALLVTPVNVREVLSAKIIFGFIVSFMMGFMILLLNNALGTNLGIIIIVLVLSSLTVATLGSLLGYKMKDVMSVINLTKSFMLLIYAPAILNLFPQIPGWIQKIFSTYYMFSPIMKLSDGRFTFAADGWEIIALAGIFVLLQTILDVVVKKSEVTGTFRLTRK